MINLFYHNIRGGRLFLIRKNKFIFFAVNVSLARASNKAEIAISFHALRHSFLTGLVNKGIPLPQVQKIAGHSNITTTAIYMHFSDKVDANAVIIKTDINFSGIFPGHQPDMVMVVSEKNWKLFTLHHYNQ